MMPGMGIAIRASSRLWYLLEEARAKDRKYAIFSDNSCYIIAIGGNASTRLTAFARYATSFSLFR
jgi:hypothetical protein